MYKFININVILWELQLRITVCASYRPTAACDVMCYLGYVWVAVVRHNTGADQGGEGHSISICFQICLRMRSWPIYCMCVSE